MSAFEGPKVDLDEVLRRVDRVDEELSERIEKSEFPYQVVELNDLKEHMDRRFQDIHTILEEIVSQLKSKEETTNKEF